VTIVDDVVSQVIYELHQVPAIATQAYATPIILTKVNSIHTELLDKFWWPRLMKLFTVALDGVTGIPTTDLTGPISSIDDFKDIQFVWPEGSPNPLKTAQDSYNPTLYGGTTPLLITPSYDIAHRPFAVLPAGATGNVVVRARQRPPEPLSLGDTVYLDKLALAYGAAWRYTTDDATVPAAIDLFHRAYEDRKKTLAQQINSQSISFYGSVAEVNTGWWEA